MPRAWSFLVLSDEDRRFAGNEGYDDELGVHYSFDTTVPNHCNVRRGDLALVRDRDFALGIGSIDHITEQKDVPKRIFDTGALSAGTPASRHERKNTRDTGAVSASTEFGDPRSEVIAVTKFTARYGASWEPFDELLAARELEDVYKGRASQHAIRELDMPRLRRALAGRNLQFT